MLNALPYKCMAIVRNRLQCMRKQSEGEREEVNVVTNHRTKHLQYIVCVLDCYRSELLTRVTEAHVTQTKMEKRMHASARASECV